MSRMSEAKATWIPATEPFDLADATSGGATGDSTFLHSIDQSSAQSRVNIYCGQGIGLLSIYRSRRALQHLLLSCLVLTPVISLAQSTQTSPSPKRRISVPSADGG